MAAAAAAEAVAEAAAEAAAEAVAQAAEAAAALLERCDPPRAGCAPRGHPHAALGSPHHGHADDSKRVGEVIHHS